MASTAEAVEPRLTVSPNTRRLRCDGGHRFVGSVGATTIVDTRCRVTYSLTKAGTYERLV